MATVSAVKNGNWSDNTVWSTGSLPTSADDVFANNFTVTVDGNYTVLSITNRSLASPVIAANGTFLLSNNVTLNATTVRGGAASGYAVTCNLTSGNSATLNVDSIQHGNSASLAYGVGNHSTGTLNVIASNTIGFWGFTGGSVIRAPVVLNRANGTINLVTGSILPSGWNTSAADECAVLNQSYGIINITCPAIYNNVIVGVGNFSGVVNYYGTTNIIGNAIPRLGTRFSVWNYYSGGVVNITGSAEGTLYTGQTGSAVYGESGTTTTITGPVIARVGGAAVSSGSPLATILLSGPLIFSPESVNPVTALSWRWKANANASYMTIQTNDLAVSKTLYTSDYATQLMMPSTANVRANVVYGPSNELTGTCIIPPAASVRVGVPVDNTVGIAAITAADFWNYPRANANVADSMGERLANCATIESTGDQIRYLL